MISVIRIFAFLSLILPAISNLLLILVSRREYQRWAWRWEAKQVKCMFWMCLSRAVGASRSVMYAMYRRITIVIAAAFECELPYFRQPNIFSAHIRTRNAWQSAGHCGGPIVGSSWHTVMRKSLYIRKKKHIQIVFVGISRKFIALFFFLKHSALLIIISHEEMYYSGLKKWT